MTEMDWLMTGTRPAAMLTLARKRVDARRLQLIACALCRLEQSVLCPAFVAALTYAEHYADGVVTEAELERAAAEPEFRRPGQGAMRGAIWSAVRREDLLRSTTDFYNALHWHFQSVRPHSGWQAECCDLIREIAGNPFRKWSVDPAFLGGGLTTPGGKTLRFTTDVRHLARGIAADQDFRRLPILADAAEEMGVDDAEMLEHLRRPGGHVRGCWALDVLDGKG